MIYETECSPFRKFEQMDFTLSVWIEKWYPKICDILQINAEEDENALKEVLSVTQSKMAPEDLAKIVSKGEMIVIFAPGVNLEDEFERNYPIIMKKESILISADGATSYLMEQGIIPHLIVTDLDGNLEHQFKAQESGSTLVIHVHGDNKNIVLENMEDLTRFDFLFTTQIKPLKGSYNFYGFTDGDRAVCLSTIMKAREIILAGFDYGSTIGKYSKNYELAENMKKRKMQKFVIAKSVINWCSNNGQKILA